MFNKENKSISAVLFCYNESRYIERCIASLQAQSYALDMIIVVDDFSSDDTASIVKEMSDKDNRILLLTNSYEKGKVGAYQTGLEAVSTDYFFVIGSDDEASPSLADLSLKKVQSESLAFIFHSAELIDENSSPLGRTFISSFDPATCFYYNKTGGLIFGKKEIIQKMLPFPKKLEFEDWYTVLILFQAYGIIKTYSQPLVRYRIHSESDSQASRWNWYRRKGLLERDIRFLKLMLERSKDDVFKVELIRSIRFREKLLNGYPSIGKDVKTSLILLKTYFSFALSRLMTRLNAWRIKSQS